MSVILFYFISFYHLLSLLAVVVAVVAASHSGELKGEEWEGPNGTLARLLLLDQFPRTVYRWVNKWKTQVEHERRTTVNVGVSPPGWYQF